MFFIIELFTLIKQNDKQYAVAQHDEKVVQLWLSMSQPRIRYNAEWCFLYAESPRNNQNFENQDFFDKHKKRKQCNLTLMTL